jgi:hypothetical protein
MWFYTNEDGAKTSDDYTVKSLKHDSAQKARDARRKIFQE